MFRDEFDDTEILEERNSYLDNPQKGLELIKKLMHRNETDSNVVDEILTEKIFPILARLEFWGKAEFYQELMGIRNRLKEQRTLKILKRKKILGVGGAFSAGKSCFINSVTNAHLPVGLKPTTSIATYIVSGKDRYSTAVSKNGSIIPIDDEAVAALTHQFYEKYKISFSRLISNLIIYTPALAYPDVVLLDTPGYDKSDPSKKNKNSDKELARIQLQMADYLIWLVDGERGVITREDLNFLSSLNIKTEILVILTKADCVEPSNLAEKIKYTEETLKYLNKKIYSVIAYDSSTHESVIGEGILDKFLDGIQRATVKVDNATENLNAIQSTINEHLRLQRVEIAKKLKQVEELLTYSGNIEHISAVVDEYRRCRVQLLTLKDSQKELEKYFQELIRIVQT